MKRFYFLLIISFLVGLVSCQQELLIDDRNEPIEFAEFSINLQSAPDGEEENIDSKSVINVGAEAFKKAVLWAFYTENGVSHCLSKQTNESVFSWALPLKTAMDIYCIVNYGDIDVSSYLDKDNLSKSTLDALTFTCPNYSAFVNLGTTSGLPKAGVTSVSNSVLQTGNEELIVTVKNLFAKFTVQLDISDLTSLGYSVVAEGATVYNMNTSVHYFGSGDKNTVSGITNAYDRALSEDLTLMSNGNQVTFYVLENMQGTIGSTCKWYDVSDKGSAVDKCTFLSVPLRIQRTDGTMFTTWPVFYLTTDNGKMKDGNVFNIERNKTSTLTYKIKYDLDANTGIFFRFNGTSHEYSVSPGGSVNISYETNCPTKSFSFDHSGLSYVDNGESVTVSCPLDIISGEYILTGTGTKEDKNYQDQVKIRIEVPEELEVAIRPGNIPSRNTYIGQKGYMYFTKVPTGTVSVSAQRKSGLNYTTLDSQNINVGLTFNDAFSGWEQQGIGFMSDVAGSMIVTLSAKDSGGNVLAVKDVDLNVLMPTVSIVSPEASQLTSIGLSPVGTAKNFVIRYLDTDSQPIEIGTFDNAIFSNKLDITYSGATRYIDFKTEKNEYSIIGKLYCKDVPNYISGYGSSVLTSFSLSDKSETVSEDFKAYIMIPFEELKNNPINVGKVVNDSYLKTKGISSGNYINQYNNTVSDTEKLSYIDSKYSSTATFNYPSDYQNIFAEISGSEGGDLLVSLKDNKLIIEPDPRGAQDYTYGNKSITARVRNEHSQYYTPDVTIGNIELYLASIPAYSIQFRNDLNPKRATLDPTVAGYDLYDSSYRFESFRRMRISGILDKPVFIFYSFKSINGVNSSYHEESSGNVYTYYSDELSDYGTQLNPMDSYDQKFLMTFSCIYSTDPVGFNSSGTTVMVVDNNTSLSVRRGEWDSVSNYLSVWGATVPNTNFSVPLVIKDYFVLLCRTGRIVYNGIIY